MKPTGLENLQNEKKNSNAICSNLEIDTVKQKTSNDEVDLEHIKTATDKLHSFLF